VRIPQRQSLGVTKQDKQNILTAIKQWLEREGLGL
jgi:phage gpG-like protein